MNCDEARVALGALVVGALDDAEAAQVQQHLQECDECRAEYEELREMPRLLGLVPLTEVTAGAMAAPVGLREEIVRRTVDERRRQRFRRVIWTAVGGVAVAGAAAAVGFGLANGSAAEESLAPDAQVLSASDPVTGVSGEVHLDGVAWGTKLDLELAGVTAGETCRLVAVSSTGERETTATWTIPDKAPADGYLSVPGAAALSPDLIDTFEVVTDAGAMILQLSFADLVE